MPAYFTHRAAGERVLRELDAGAILHNRAFFLGCQGPDILYFYRSLVTSGLPLGLAMHSQKTRELINHALNFIKKYDEKDKDELISYLAGFIVHYTVDKNTHPFIYGKSGRNVGIHHAMEYMWDSYTSKEEWDIELQHFDVFSDVVYGDLGEGISKWYVSVARDIYGKRLRIDTTRRAQLNFAKSKARMFTNPQLIKRAFLWVTSGFKMKEMLFSDQYNHLLFSSEEYSLMKRMIINGVNEACNIICFMFRYINGEGEKLPGWVVEKNFAGVTLPTEAAGSLAY